MNIEKDLQFIEKYGFNDFSQIIENEQKQLEQRKHLITVLHICESIIKAVSEYPMSFSLGFRIFFDEKERLDVRVGLFDEVSQKAHMRDITQNTDLPLFSFIKEKINLLQGMPIYTDKDILNKRHGIKIDEHFTDNFLKLFLSQDLRNIYLKQTLEEKISTHELNGAKNKI